jgi:hypothetical protein
MSFLLVNTHCQYRTFFPKPPTPDARLDNEIGWPGPCWRNQKIDRSCYPERLRAAHGPGQPLDRFPVSPSPCALSRSTVHPVHKRVSEVVPQSRRPPSNSSSSLQKLTQRTTCGQSWSTPPQSRRPLQKQILNCPATLNQRHTNTPQR